MWNYSTKPDILSYRCDRKVDSELGNCNFLYMLSTLLLTMRNLTTATIKTSITNQEMFMLKGPHGTHPQ